MTVTFYSVDDDSRVVTKTLGTPTLTLNNVKLKDDTDVIDPVLELANNVNLMGSNYFYIQEFGRYYNVTDQKTNSLGFFITGHVDVLTSWDSDIRTLDCIVKRNANKYNAYIPDERMLMSAYENVMTIPFPNSFSNSMQLLLAVNGR